MSQYRMLVATVDSNDIARDRCVNTFYLDTDALSGADDPQALADDTAALWAGIRGYPAPFDEIEVRAYDMSDPLPRLPVAEVIVPIPVHTVPCGPREVALCLSYYAGRNVPRKRGRMFYGPWASSVLSERPGAPERDVLKRLAEGISGLGGINVQWVQRSATVGDYTNVSNWWVDDEWDTVRSRGLRALTRLEGTVSG